MRYEKGDRVFIRPDLKEDVKYGGWVYIFPDSLKRTDRLVTITKVNGDCYDVSHPHVYGLMGHITDEMIAGYGFEWGEKMSVSDDSIERAINGANVHFCGWSFVGNSIKYVSGSGVQWNFAVPVPPAPKTVTITLTEAQLEEVKKIIKI